MASIAQLPIRRRDDGSIDIEYYAARAARLRRAAMRKQARRWAAACRRWLTAASGRPGRSGRLLESH